MRTFLNFVVNPFINVFTSIFETLFVNFSFQKIVICMDWKEGLLLFFFFNPITNKDEWAVTCKPATQKVQRASASSIFLPSLLLVHWNIWFHILYITFFYCDSIYSLEHSWSPSAANINHLSLFPKTWSFSSPLLSIFLFKPCLTKSKSLSSCLFSFFSQSSSL